MAVVSGDLRCERILCSPELAVHRWFWVLCAPRCESYLWRRMVRTLGCQILFAVVVVCAGSVEGSVGVLVKLLTTILRKLDAEDFTSEKLLRHFGIQRQIESFPARPCVRMFCSCHSRLTLYCYDNCGCCYHNKCLCCGQFAPQQPRLPKCSGTEIVRICTRISP